MRSVVQRVTRAKVTVEEAIIGEIEHGLVVLLGVHRNDSERDADYLAEKIVSLRIFSDSDGKMNQSVRDVVGGVLVVSQFTLLGDVRRGLRPSWSDAAEPAAAERLYEHFVERVRAQVKHTATGGFRQMMKVELVNDGPVTILLDSHRLF